MDTNETHERAIELLQQLGLKEYEANCFVALSRVQRATAKEISEISNVPRTRVYDATRVLEAKGLVETQHSSPQQFRAVPVEEGLETLRQQYQSRVGELGRVLEDLDAAEPSSDEVTHEVWSLSGGDGIATRTENLIDDAVEEIVIVIGSERALTDELYERLDDAIDRGVSVIVGALTESIYEQLDANVDGAQLFVSGLEWLDGPDDSAHHQEIVISRLCLVDKRSILVSSIDSNGRSERAVFGTGFENGLVVVVRRLMATGLLQSEDPDFP